MRFVKMMAASAALALSAIGPQANATLAVIQTGTITADSSGNFTLPVEFFPYGYAWRGAVQFDTSAPVTSHIDMSLLQSIYMQRTHGGAFISSSTITGSTPSQTTSSFYSQYRLGGWPFHLNQHLRIALYSNGIAQLVGQTAPGGSFSYQLRAPEVPEPATWALMIVGFGAIGGALRRRKVHVAHAGLSTALKSLATIG